MTLKYRQGHRQCRPTYHLKSFVWFLINSFSNCGRRFLYTVWDIGRENDDLIHGLLITANISALPGMTLNDLHARMDKSKVFCESSSRNRICLFLLFARYVPNVAKRSIWDQCKKYILSTDRPTTDDLTFGKISNGHISAADYLIYSVFGSMMGFSGSADRMALIPVWPNSIGMWEKTMREVGHNLKYFLFHIRFITSSGDVALLRA